MPKSKRIITYVGIILQAYAVYAALMWAFLLPPKLTLYFLALPRRPAGYFLAFVLYYLGYTIQNGMLTSEFVRKTELESEQIAARQIQQTLQPQNPAAVPGYEIASFYRPFRDVGGDYFDVIELAGGRTLFTIADVSGKGMPAALLAANIQALVRSIATAATTPLEFAQKINQHLKRYTPSDRFATAVFAVLDGASGQLTYVNAGHNAPVISAAGKTSLLGATGVPLGLMSEAEYETGSVNIPAGGMLLLYTDGLTDSIGGCDPEKRLSDALVGHATSAIDKLKSLMNPKFNQDDVTILLVRRSEELAQPHR